MEYERFNQMVVEHRNSMILIGTFVLMFIVVGFYIVEFYVRRQLDCPYFKVGKFRFSPTLLMLIPLILTLIFFPIKVYQCNYDINNLAYETYIGDVEYSKSSVKLEDVDLTFFVGKGHQIIPLGSSYGMVVHSQKAHVVVYYKQLDPT